MSHSARVWDYWLGGRDNYPVDREVGDRIAAMLPDIVTQARADRMFLGRVVRYLAGEAGVRQFLDIGTTFTRTCTTRRTSSPADVLRRHEAGWQRAPLGDLRQPHLVQLVFSELTPL